MKKILSIIALLVALAGTAAAQISIKKSDVSKPKMMTTLSMSWSWIYQQDEAYFIVMKSDNQFDDYYWLKIGSTKDECLDGLNSLLELAESIGETDRYEIDNGEGETFTASQYKVMGVKGLQFRCTGYAGVGYIIPSNLNKAIKWIQTNLK